MEVLNVNSKGVRIIRIDYKHRSAVKVVAPNGSNIRTYRMYNVPFYEHQYLSWRCLDFCNGWAHDDELDIINGMKANRKLVGTVSFMTENGTKAEASAFIKANNITGKIKAKVAMKPWQTYFGDWVNNIVAVRKGRLIDFFDLDEIRIAYLRQGVGFSMDELKQIEDYASQTLEEVFLNHYKGFDLFNPKTDVELVIDGLGLGYPIESTASIIFGY